MPWLGFFQPFILFEYCLAKLVKVSAYEQYLNSDNRIDR